MKSLSVAGIDLPVADSIKVLCVTLDRRLTFDNHVSAVARSCIYQLGLRSATYVSANTGPSADACMYPDSLQNRLLQRCAIRRSIRHHSEATASTKQRGENRKSGTTTISCQLAAAGAALAADGTTHHVQAGRTDWPTRHDRRQCWSRPIWAATSRHAAVRGHCDRHQLHYGKFLSDVHQRSLSSFSIAVPSVWNSLPINICSEL